MKLFILHLHVVDKDDFAVYLLDTKFLQFIIRLDHTVENGFHLWYSGVTNMGKIVMKEKVYMLKAVGGMTGGDRDFLLLEIERRRTFADPVMKMEPLEGGTMRADLLSSASSIIRHGDIYTLVLPTGTYTKNMKTGELHLIDD